MESKVQQTYGSSPQEAANLPSAMQQSGKKVATLVYALQALSFLFGLTYIVGVVINYIKKEDVAGTWLESHFRWQIRTFWFSVLWAVLGVITAMVVVGYFIIIANLIWVIYRIAKGWLRLNDGKPMYAA